jgi:hypothetical protein
VLRGGLIGIGTGQAHPNTAASNQTEEGRAKNWRVELVESAATTAKSG